MGEAVAAGNRAGPLPHTAAPSAQRQCSGAPAPHSYAWEIERQREAWRRKPVLRALYHDWYGQCVSALAEVGPTVEVGSGSGNFKSYYPALIATDVIQDTGADLVADAMALPLRAGTVGNIIAFDVIHHLQRPLEFLRQAMAALKPRGRLVICDPAVSLWSKVVYGLFHHEPLDLKWPLFDLDKRPRDPDPGHFFTNQAIAEILFWRGRAQTLSELGLCRLVEARKFGFMLYPLSGGFSNRCLLPVRGLRALIRLEDTVTKPVARWLTGMRMLVVLEKTTERISNGGSGHF
jgi:SAM-dependent methyltransferase